MGAGYSLMSWIIVYVWGSLCMDVARMCLHFEHMRAHMISNKAIFGECIICLGNDCLHETCDMTHGHEFFLQCVPFLLGTACWYAAPVPGMSSVPCWEIVWSGIASPPSDQVLHVSHFCAILFVQSSKEGLCCDMWCGLLRAHVCHFCVSIWGKCWTEVEVAPDGTAVSLEHWKSKQNAYDVGSLVECFGPLDQMLHNWKSKQLVVLGL